MTCFMRSIPLQGAALPHVDVSGTQNAKENEHFDQEKAHPRPVRRCRGPGPRAAEIDRRPRPQEHRLDVEHDEQHRDEIELDREALVGAAERRHAALVRSVFQRRRAAGSEKVRQQRHPDGVRENDGEEDQEREIGLQHELVKNFTWPLWEKLVAAFARVNRIEWRKSRWRRYIAPPCPSSPIAGSSAWPPSTT